MSFTSPDSMIEVIDPSKEFDQERWIFEHLNLRLEPINLCGSNCPGPSNLNFPKKNHRSIHNASRLIEKYNNLAREALSNGDKILSESYFQHSDHFIRIQNEKEKNQENINSEKNKQVSQLQTVCS